MKKKVRINELARELEVKPNKILELLPELGVQEKKTHSSSIDEDVAVIVKQRLAGSSDADYVHDEDENGGHDDFGGHDSGDAGAEGSHEVADPVMTRTAEARGSSYEQVAVAEAPPTVEHHAPPARPLAAPLRPPLGGTVAHRDTAPHAPPPPHSLYRPRRSHRPLSFKRLLRLSRSPASLPHPAHGHRCPPLRRRCQDRHPGRQFQHGTCRSTGPVRSCLDLVSRFRRA